jgi:hypothetical protein
MRFTRTVIVGTLAALIPAPNMLAETASPTRPAGPISVELAKKCRDLALKAHPKPRRQRTVQAGAARILRDLHRQRRQCAGIGSTSPRNVDPPRHRLGRECRYCPHQKLEIVTRTASADALGPTLKMHRARVSNSPWVDGPPVASGPIQLGRVL